MSQNVEQVLQDKFLVISDIGSEIWRAQQSPDAYHHWYFDALSDEGDESVIIEFQDNSSPEAGQDHLRTPRSGNVPAVTFLYARRGKPIYKSSKQFASTNFSASRDAVSCAIDHSYFRFEDGPYGSGFIVSLDVPLVTRGRVEAHFEWLSIESGFSPGDGVGRDKAHIWNVSVPRSDVTGRVTVFNKRGKPRDVLHFRGTGYHDERSDVRRGPCRVGERVWGRAHFVDCTAVFYRYSDNGDAMPQSKLCVVRDDEFQQFDAEYQLRRSMLGRRGLVYPTLVNMSVPDHLELLIKPVRMIDLNFNTMRCLAEMTLDLKDGKPRKADGLFQFVTPRPEKYRWLKWINDLRRARGN